MIIEESDIALVAAGNMLITALAVRDKLKEKGYNITVVNERFIKPVDTDMLDRLSESHRLIVTMEENVLSGGFGEAVCQYYDDTCNDIDVLNMAMLIFCDVNQVLIKTVLLRRYLTDGQMY